MRQMQSTNRVRCVEWIAKRHASTGAQLLQWGYIQVNAMQRTLETLIGRREIFTHYAEVTSDNIIEVLKDARNDFAVIMQEAEFLLLYEKGVQPLQRTKLYRPDIDIKCADNLANEISEFHTALKWSGDITLTNRNVTIDVDEPDKDRDEVSRGINALNREYDLAGVDAITQGLGRFTENVGLCYELVDIADTWEAGEPKFKLIVLDPRFSFLVKSTYYADHRDVLGVTFSRDRDGNEYYTCFTPRQRFEIVNCVRIGKRGKPLKGTGQWREAERSGEKNPFGMIPIVEWPRSYDRMGVWERQISEMDALSIAVSDFYNDIDQNTQAVFHTNDIEFQKDPETGEVITPESGDWVQTHTTPDGREPFIKPIAVDYDYSGMLANILARRSLILQKCGVPQRNDDSGGSTGTAMDTATGWTQADIAASKQHCLMKRSKMREIKLVLKAISLCPGIPADDPMLCLNAGDIDVNFNRPKSYELNTKVNAFATAVSHGIHGLHALKLCDMFSDVQEVYEDSKELIDKYQKSLFEKNNSSTGNGSKAVNGDRLMGDESDQISNSPYIDGTGAVR